MEIEKSKEENRRELITLFRQICRLDAVAIVEELTDPHLNDPQNIWGSFFSLENEYHEEHHETSSSKKSSSSHQADHHDTWWHAHLKSHATVAVPYLEHAL